jgi:hypothetical protein
MTPLQLSRLFGLKRTLALSVRRLPSLQALRLPVDADDVDLGTLTRIPITDKHRFKAQCEEWLECNHALPDFFVSTGGTTGAPVVAWGFLPPHDAEQIMPVDEGPRPLCIYATAGRQGEKPLPAASRLGSIAVPLRDQSGYLNCLALLQRKFSFTGFEPRISSAVLPLPAAKKLAHVMMVRGIQSRLLALTELHTYSSYLSRKWRTRLETVIGAKVIDTYGFTEIMDARASECCHCGHYHFGVNVLWELVDSVGRAILQRGKAGRLLVTQLLDEFDRKQPVLRFDTGDLCELGPVCTAVGEQGFRPFGKLVHSCHFRTSDGVDLYPVRYGGVLEAIDTSPLVARISNTRHSGVTQTEGESFAKWRFVPGEAGPHGGVVGVTLEIEMNFEPALFPEHWQAFEAELRAELSANTSDYQVAVQQGFVLWIRGLAPGSLSDSEVMRS